MPEKAAEAAVAAGIAAPLGSVQIDHSSFGAGYALPTDECREALDLAARLEGLILDPVYTGKAMAGLVKAVRTGRIEPGMQVVFVHTGGMPALFSPRFASWIEEAWRRER
ncbi:MAG TPA: pyridoxal-phosphate dependent enzyme [Acidimicrobiales bacterium]|nr:pyridoxal-phosphate dependent enzyme [Acidimicrobiales bacterium]